MTTISHPNAPRKSAFVLAFLAVYFIWGSTYLGVQFALTSIPPLLMAGSRFIVAGVFLYGLLRLRGEQRPPFRAWRTAFLVGGCILAVGNGGVTFAQQHLSSGLAALLSATVPLLLALLGWLSGVAARPVLPVAVGLGAGLLGIVMLTQNPAGISATYAGHYGYDIALALTSALATAIGTLYAKKEPAASPFLAAGMQLISGGGLLLLGGLVRGEAADLHVLAITARSWLAFAYLIVFGSLIAFTAYNWLLQVVEPALAGTYAFVNPIVAVLLGWGFASERLSSPLMGSAGLIGLAVLLVIVGQRKAAY